MHRTEVDFLYDLFETIAEAYGRRDVLTDTTDGRDEEAVVAMAGALADASHSAADETDSVRSE